MTIVIIIVTIPVTQTVVHHHHPATDTRRLVVLATVTTITIVVRIIIIIIIRIVIEMIVTFGTSSEGRELLAVVPAAVVWVGTMIFHRPTTMIVVVIWIFADDPNIVVIVLAVPGEIRTTIGPRFMTMIDTVIVVRIAIVPLRYHHPRCRYQHPMLRTIIMSVGGADPDRRRRILDVGIPRRKKTDWCGRIIGVWSLVVVVAVAVLAVEAVRVNTNVERVLVVVVGVVAMIITLVVVPVRRIDIGIAIVKRVDIVRSRMNES